MRGFTWTGEWLRVNRVVLAAFAACGLVAIAMPAVGLPTYKMITPFKEQDFQPWVGAGPANLHGQAFLKTVGGDVKTCAGERVILMPYNPYDEEIVAADSKGFSDVNADPHMTSYFRESICDAQGNFAFFGLPAGGWYLDTKVTWQIPHLEQPGERPGPLTSLLLGVPSPPTSDQQGGELRKAIRLEPGENQAILTAANQVISGSAQYLAGLSLPKSEWATNGAPHLGVRMIPTPAAMWPLLKMDRSKGLWVLTIDQDSAATRAGLSRGDVILSGNGMQWDTVEQAIATLNALHPGENLRLVIWKAGTENIVLVKF